MYQVLVEVVLTLASGTDFVVSSPTLRVPRAFSMFTFKMYMPADIIINAVDLLTFECGLRQLRCGCWFSQMYRSMKNDENGQSGINFTFITLHFHCPQSTSPSTSLKISCKQGAYMCSTCSANPNRMDHSLFCSKANYCTGPVCCV